MCRLSRNFPHEALIFQGESSQGQRGRVRGWSPGKRPQRDEEEKRLSRGMCVYRVPAGCLCACERCFCVCACEYTCLAGEHIQWVRAAGITQEKWELAIFLPPSSQDLTRSSCLLRPWPHDTGIPFL